jgi:hypothetical protein
MEGRIRIRIKVKSRIRIRFKVIRWKPKRLILEHWRVQIWEKVPVNGRIRTRIRMKLKVESISE